MLFRVELIDLFYVVCHLCVVPLSEVLNIKRSTFAESIGALGAMEPHRRGAGKQWAFPAGRSALAVDRDMDVNLPWGVT